MSENEILDVTMEVTKEIAKDVYNDAGKPIAKPTGELLGLVPRAIKAALMPVEKWVIQREYNVEETKRLLEQKLKNLSPDLIETPEPYIAVPALQYISYCMDNNELRDMYANLLANSMNKVVKNGVHPGFVEIIKQLSPDEAKILKYMSNNHKVIPTISLKYEIRGKGGITIIENFSTVGEEAGCEFPYQIQKCFDNLCRLGLLYDAKGMASFTDKTKYEPLKNHKNIVPLATVESAKLYGNEMFHFDESIIRLTSFGESFCSICLETQTKSIVGDKVVTQNDKL